MITFLTHDRENILIKAISTEQSKQIAAVDGSDVSNISEVIKYIKNNNIKNVFLSLSYYEDERKLLESIAIHKSNANGNMFKIGSVTNNNSNEKTENESSLENDKKNKTFVCPVCGSDEGLVDKNGNTHPCLSCLQIDIGKKISEKIGKEFALVVNKNNMIIDELIKIFTPKKESDDKQD